MSEEFEISYDPDWLTVQVVFIAALSAAIGHGLGSNFDNWIVTLVATSGIVAVLVFGWAFFSVWPRVQEVDL